MIQKHTPSPVPYYLTGLFWLIYSLFFPMYQIFHFAIVAVLSAGVFFIGKKVFPGTTVEFTAPANTGNEVFDERIDQLAAGLDTLKELQTDIKNAETASKINELETITGEILGIIRKEPEKTRQMQTFFAYYLPAALKLLQSYADLSAQKTAGENLRQSLSEIENALDTIVTVFSKELDGLFLGKAIDISAEIKILQQLAGQ